MSMVKIGSITPSTAAAIEASRLCWVSAIARYARIRREQLGLTIDRAAELSGMEVSQWVALEDSWVPEERAMLHSIATTLRVRWSDFDLVALFARAAQQRG
jgi:transcriptional regulator with XRE-family HTH domain